MHLSWRDLSGRIECADLQSSTLRFEQFDKEICPAKGLIFGTKMIRQRIGRYARPIAAALRSHACAHRLVAPVIIQQRWFAKKVAKSPGKQNMEDIMLLTRPLMWLMCAIAFTLGANAFEMALKQVEHQYGKGAVMRLGRFGSHAVVYGIQTQLKSICMIAKRLPK